VAKVIIKFHLLTYLSVKNHFINDIFVSKMKKQRCNKDLLFGIAQRIKQLREEKNISQEVFYIDTDIHIARIETGKLNITVSTLQAICEYFEISLSDFFKGMK
jgi:DNA-binding Xre family transcriptional regulator